MDDIHEIDVVLKQVRQAAQQQHRIPDDVPITQQILLFGDLFYGYRFTARSFTAIWSAADQHLKVFDVDGNVLSASSPTEPSGDESLNASASATPMTMKRRAA